MTTRAAPILLPALTFLVPTFLAGAAEPLPDAAPAAQKAAAETKQADRLQTDDLLWRIVVNREGESLGIVSDLLAQMPSGQIQFVSVAPDDLPGRPKVVPPRALTVPAERNTPIVLDITRAQWLEAPLLDWNEAMVIKNTDEGIRIYAFYQQRWIEPPPGVGWAMKVVVPEQDRSEVERYVSLKKLIHERLVAEGGRQAGYLGGFLIDWPHARATHALVSPEFPPVPESSEDWLAVPVSLLQPPVEYDAIAVRASRDAFADAPRVPDLAAVRGGDAAEIVRYPVPTPAATQSAE